MSTQEQATVGGALSNLGFESVPSEVLGGPAKYKVTADTLQKLKEGTVLTVDSAGSVSIDSE